MAKLATLAEAKAQHMNDASPARRAQAHMRPNETWRDHERARKPSGESREPPGVREGASSASHPEHGNLFDWFAARLARATSEPEVLKLVTIAEARWELATGRTKAPLGLAANPETTKTRDQRIARDADYLGLVPEIVAAAETHVSGYVSPENVRRVRLADGREPETGLPLPPERQIKGPARKKRAKELDDAQMPLVEIARRFGVHPSTVLGWLGRRGGENGEKAA